MKNTHLSIFLSILLCITTMNTYTRLIDITNAEQYKQLINTKQPIVVKFAADWCGVCQGVKDPFKQVAQEKEFNTITFAQVDVSTLKDLSKQHDVAGVPTFVYVQDGKQVNQEVGVQNMVTFKDDLRTNLRKTFDLAQNKITEMERDDSTPGNIEQDKKPMPSTEKKSKPAPGIFASVKNFFAKIIELIKNAIKYVIDKITGIFR